MNKLWKKLDQLSTRCYEDMIQSNPTMDNWDEAFSVLVEITEEGRQRDSSFAQEMYQLEESIEYKCDVTGWFEDYMDELEMCERYDRLQYVCEKVLQLFQWKEESPSDIKFHIAFAMAGQGKNEETLLQVCKFRVLTVRKLSIPGVFKPPFRRHSTANPVWWIPPFRALDTEIPAK